MRNQPFLPANDGELYDTLTPDSEHSEEELTEEEARFTHQNWIALSLAILVLLVGAITVVSLRGSDSASTATRNAITGEITLGAKNYDKYVGSGDGTPCFGYRGYSDVKSGAQVLLLDGAGVTIATSSLNPGVVSNDRSECVFTFTLPDAPKADFYRVKISHRDGPTWSAADLEGRGWRVELTLG